MSLSLEFTLQESGHSRSSTVSLAGTLSKKTSQLINILNSKRKMNDSEAVLSRIELTAGVMTAAKALISWLERNPSSIISDYNNFKQEVLRSTLDLSSILVGPNFVLLPILMLSLIASTGR